MAGLTSLCQAWPGSTGHLMAINISCLQSRINKHLKATLCSRCALELKEAGSGAGNIKSQLSNSLHFIGTFSVACAGSLRVTKKINERN